MITIIYTIKPEEKATELEWLRELRIFPGMCDGHDWVTGKTVVRLAMIVTPDCAMMIKLRRELDLQIEDQVLQTTESIKKRYERI